ncbi:MAG TPA: hypothetical protein VF837_03900 [Patescibacteria group bacterium]
MSKQRKTRSQKIHSQKRLEEASAFSVKPEWIKKSDKSIVSPVALSKDELHFFKTDLTKTLFLTMLVLALELALWQYLSRH